MAKSGQAPWLQLPALLLVIFFLQTTVWGKSELAISKVDRKIDLQSHCVRTSTSIKVENKGSDATDTFYFALPKDQAERLSFIKAVTAEGKQKSRSFVPLAVAEVPVADDPDHPDFSLYPVTFHKKLGKGESVTIEVYHVLTGVLKAHPAEITQADPQLLLFRDSHYFPSAYPVKSQVTSVRLPNQNVESYTKKEPTKKSDLDLKFGPYNDVDAFALSPLTVHFENNRPLAQVESLVREIEISHWGNIYVTENYVLKHAGARHKGSFSRLDYQSKPMASGVASLRGLLARLPPRARSVYYRDEIGNISTSHLRSDFRKTELELEPRYPLMGGWSVTFTLGYSVPLEDFVFRMADGRRGVNITFGSPFHDVTVEQLTVKVILPEGAGSLQARVPFTVEQYQEEKFTYLDTVGRPVVVLKKSNVVPEHSAQYFLVAYSFSPAALLVEPLLLVGAFLLFFLACVAYVRIDLTISKNTASYQAKQQQEEVSDALQRLQKVMFQRTSITDKLDASLHHLARTGDVAAAKLARKVAEAGLKETSAKLKAITDLLEGSAKPASVLPKVQALVVKEKERQAQALQKHQVMVEAYERKLAPKEIDQRVAPVQQRFLALKNEVKDLLVLIEDC